MKHHHIKEYWNKDSSKQRLIPINCQYCNNKLFAVYIMQFVQIALIPTIFLWTDNLNTFKNRAQANNFKNYSFKG